MNFNKKKNEKVKRPAITSSNITPNPSSTFLSIRSIGQGLKISSNRKTKKTETDPNNVTGKLKVRSKDLKTHRLLFPHNPLHLFVQLHSWIHIFQG